MDKDNNNIYETAKQKFTEYLTEKNYRKTQERYLILELIYAEQRDFDIDSLYEAMEKTYFKVSRGTLYNTLQLLIDCNLVFKHQLGKSKSIYVRAYNNNFSYHLICTQCRKIQSYSNDNINAFFKKEKVKYFTPTNYKLDIYGLCSVCARNIKSKKTVKK